MRTHDYLPGVELKDAQETADILRENIRERIHRMRSITENRSRSQRLADAITEFSGSMTSVYFHAMVFGLWSVINLGWLPLPRFDPTFVILAAVTSVEAIFLSTFILISQNRLARLSEERAEMDLEINMLSELEISRLMSLCSRMQRGRRRR